MVHLATHPDGAPIRAATSPRRPRPRVPKGMTDPDLARALWDASAAVVG